jgi:branched-chain amino acid transport system permease protein
MLAVRLRRRAAAVRGGEYWLHLHRHPDPFLIFSLAALGLNILTGYAGQLSLGLGGLHGGGRLRGLQLHAAHRRHPDPGGFVLAGLTAAAVGILFGLPSLRIKGFYLAVATLAAQFFIVWALTKFGLVLQLQRPRA